MKTLPFLRGDGWLLSSNKNRQIPGLEIGWEFFYKEIYVSDLVHLACGDCCWWTFKC